MKRRKVITISMKVDVIVPDRKTGRAFGDKVLKDWESILHFQADLHPGVETLGTWADEDKEDESEDEKEDE